MNTAPINKVYNLIILDESGSMESIKRATINGFNELLQSIKRSATEDPEIKQWVNFYSFNGAAVKEQVALSPAGEMLQLTGKSYRPEDMTPLYDAIGMASNKLQKALEKQSDYSVLVTILTDGEENNSKEYTHTAINSLITALKSKGWVFTYIGANHDVEKTAISLSITNHLHFTANEEDTAAMFTKNSDSRQAYMGKIKRNEKDKLQEGYFKEVNPDEN